MWKAPGPKPNVTSLIYRVIKKDGLNFLGLYFLNYIWYVNDLHNIERGGPIFSNTTARALA